MKVVAFPPVNRPMSNKFKLIKLSIFREFAVHKNAVLYYSQLMFSLDQNLDQK